jgi:glutamyl endopeptidase
VTFESSIDEDKNKIPFSAEVLGDDDRILVNDPSIYPWCCICWLTFNNGQDRGTGSLIGKRVVLTAGHNLHEYDKTNGDIQLNSIEVIPGGYTQPFGSCSSNEFWIDPRWEQSVQTIRENGGEDVEPSLHYYDYALIILPDNAPFINNNLGSFGLANFNSVQEIKDYDLCLAGCPYDKSPQGSIWYDEGAKIDEKMTEQDQHLIYYTLDTKPGESGSPVFYKKSPNEAIILGVHTRYDGTNRNYGTRMTKEITDKIIEIINQYG